MKVRVGGWKGWLIVGIAGVALLVVGGPFVYFRFVAGKAPAPLSLSSSTPTPAATTVVPADASQGSAASSSVAGTWTVTSGSQVGYRVKETLFGQSGEAVGRTDSVTGSITIAGTTVTAADFTVDMATVTSDESRRDSQFRGRIMDTSSYPRATFSLTAPISLVSIPADGVTATATATGRLTLHGVTRTVTFKLSGRRNGSTVEVSGSIPIAFADYNIANPSFVPAQTGDDGTLEFLLAFERASA